jgi:tRNA(fMet)-specific endonuclease VapC
LSLCLDTNTLIDVVNGKAIVRQRFEATLDSGAEVFTSSISAQEIMFGALISKQPDEEFAAARKVLDRITVAAFSDGDAEASARLQAELRDIGQSIGSFDTLIAGQCLNRAWAVVTANVREFSRVPDLTVINWTIDPESP